ATDTATSSIAGTAGPITVSAAAATHFAVNVPASITVGNPIIGTVTAKDAFNNTATAYAGTVHFTSSDSSAFLSGNMTLNGGSGFFIAVLNTAGTQTVTATDTVTS